MARIKFRDFSGGLAVAPGRDKGPGTLARATGARTFIGPTARSRWGSVELYDASANSGLSAAVHSLVRFHNTRWCGIDTVFGIEGFPFVRDLDGTPLTFVTGAPTSEVKLGGTIGPSGSLLIADEHLFCTGGGKLFKVGQTGLDPVTDWGIEEFPDGLIGGRIPFEQGVNFMFWELFNSIGHIVGREAERDLLLSTTIVPPDGF